MSSSEWKLASLKEIAVLNYGKSLTADKRVHGRIPVYSSSGITGYHNTPLVTEEAIIVGRKGTVGTIYYTSDPFYCIDTAYFIKKSDLKADIKYAYYLLKTLGLNHLNEDSAVPGLNRDTAYSQTFKLPPLNTQKRIASILSSIDDKIELNRQTNHTLEAIAQAIFKEWFVDFNFPGTTGEMEESELGMIPRGWRAGSIGDLFQISKESVNPSLQKDKQFVHYSLPAYDEGKKPTIETGSEILSNKFITKSNSILVSKLNPRIPRIWAILDAESNAICSTEFIVLVPKDKHFFSFGANLFWQSSIIEILKGRATGTSGSHQRVRPQDILDIQIVVPTEQILNAFDKIIKGFFTQIKNNEDENITLTALRDTLLPKLMRGEITIN